MGYTAYCECVIAVVVWKTETLMMAFSNNVIPPPYLIALARLAHVFPHRRLPQYLHTNESNKDAS